MSPMTNPLIAVAYLRVSTHKQVESGLGLEAQKAAIQGYATENNIEIVSWKVDGGVSGGAQIEDRPGLVAALSDVVGHRAGLLLVQKLDRLSRDMLTALTIEKMLKSSGAKVVSCAGEGTANDDPSNVLLRRIMSATAEHEKAIIGMRIKVSLAQKRERGERMGKPRRGFRVDEETGLLVKASDWEDVRDALVLRQSGQPWRVIGEILGCSGQAAGVALRKWKGGYAGFMRYTQEHCG